MRIALFVEDAAHESFLVGILERLMEDEACVAEVSVRNAVGGRGAVLVALRRYVRDLANGREAFAEILIVAIDANCQGVQAVTRDILEVARREGFPGRVVTAVPDPHIELWYLADGAAIFEAIGVQGSQPTLPPYKCERARYKTLLRDAFRAVGIDPPAGGSEYGADIAAAVDLARARTQADDFASFVADARSALRESAATARS
jgi:Domain of unknown function (DUF4276)